MQSRGGNTGIAIVSMAIALFCTIPVTRPDSFWDIGAI